MRFAEPERNISRFKIEPGMFVADFGAGSGAYTLPIARRVGRRGRVYAIDLAQELLQKIQSEARREGLENVELVWGNIETIGGTHLPDASINAAIVSNVLFLVRDKDMMVEEVKRVLKLNGKALVIDWKDSFGGLGPHREAIITEREAKALFEAHDFFVEREIDAGAHHFGIVCKKA